MATQKTLSIINDNGSLNFSSQATYNISSTNHTQTTSGEFQTTANSNILLETYNGHLNLFANSDVINITDASPNAGAIQLSASNPAGGIQVATGSGGFSVRTSNGDIALLSSGANVDIGISPLGTPANQQTQNITLECFNALSASSGDMYFVSSDVISFVSNTGDIQFGTSANGAPVLKFQDGNVLINQAHSALDYQLDIALTHPSASRPGYNGIMVNSFQSNVAADITLQTSDTLGDGTQGVLSIGTFGSNNPSAAFQPYLAYQQSNIVIRLDGPTYSPGTSYLGFGADFTYNDVGRQIYWPTLAKEDIITGLGTLVTATSDTANATVSGTYTGTNSRVYLIQIDSIATPNTFMWSNDGGATFQQQFVPILAVGTPITLDSGLQITFTRTTGFSLNQQITFQVKITALVGTTVSSPIDPTTVYTLQPYYSYIKTITPSDIVIKTNNTEKMRITGDGAIGIQQNMPTACLDLNSNYNKVLLANQTATGYQLNPSISYLSSGGYVLVWNAQDDTSALNFNVVGQRYLADGSRYGTNFLVNKTTSGNQSFPSVAGNRLEQSNHYIAVWTSQDATSGLYKVYAQIFHNNTPIRSYDIQIDATNPSTSNQLNARAAGLYNGSYIITWAADNTGAGAGAYAVYGCIITDNGILGGRFQISTPSSNNANFPYPAGLPSNDAYVPNGFVVGLMTAVDTKPDPRYTIAVRVMNPDGTPHSAQIPITAVGNAAYSSISDGLLSLAELNLNQVNSTYGNGGFVMAFYRNYQADVSLYNVGDNLVGELSGATATIQALDGANRVITVEDISNRLLVAEEIQITSSVPDVGNVIEKIAAIQYLTNTTANITLDTGSKNVVAYRFSSNLTQTSDAIWNIQVNTSPLFADTDRFSGNVNVFQYKRPLAAITVDNLGTALATWSNGSIPSVYYQLLDTSNGAYIGSEQRLTSGYDGLKQRDQVATHLQSLEGNDYGFVISWDNQSLDLLDTGVYQQLIGYKHGLFSLADGNSTFIFNHASQCGIGIQNPQTTLHLKSPSTSAFNDPPNPAGITLQNTSQHVITNSPLQIVDFLDGFNNTLNMIRSGNAPRYDDLAPHPETLLGFYKFDESQGTQAKDSSPYSSYLYLDSPVFINTAAILQNFDIENCWNAGLINNALLFDGNNDYCFIEAAAPNALNTALEVAQQLSISCWVNIPSNIVHGAGYDIISNGGDFTIPGTYLLSVVDVSSNGNMQLKMEISVLNPSSVVQTITLIGTSSAILNTASYHHLVITVSLDGTNSAINVHGYIDGVLNAWITKAGTIPGAAHAASRTYIGSRNGVQNFYRGYLDELRIYKSVLSEGDVALLYSYGDPTVEPKGALIINANANPSYNLGLLLDDTGKLNNLSSKPLPYSVLTGELIAYSSNVVITGQGTRFTSELTVGDILTFNLTTTPTDFVVISISSDTVLSLNQRPYIGPEPSKPYQSVLRRPSIYAFFDNGDNIRGHLDSYGNLMIGSSAASTMLEVAGTSNSAVNIPAITITNTAAENTAYGRKTSLNFRGHNATSALNSPVVLGHIETAHEGTGIDNKGIMRFFTNSGTQENNVLSLTAEGYLGIGGQNTPLGLIHATSTPYDAECTLILQSGSNAAPTSNSSVFDEKSKIYFMGTISSGETISTNINNRVLAAVVGSNDSNNHSLDGRLDFSTNYGSLNADTNGVESRMCITHNGRIGMGIQQPPAYVSMCPEQRLANGSINQITGATYDGSTYTLITINNNILAGLSMEQLNMLVGGTLVIGNTTLSALQILAITAITPPQFQVAGNYSGTVGLNCYIHYPGVNLTSNGFLGVNTTTPNAPLSIKGAISQSILQVSSNITLDISHYTILGNTTASNLTISLPVNSSSIAGRMYRIKNIGTTPANVINVDPGSSTIDGSAGIFQIPYGLGYNSTSVILQSDGAGWWFLW
jgi:hypothetical protein